MIREVPRSCLALRLELMCIMYVVEFICILHFPVVLILILRVITYSRAHISYPFEADGLGILPLHCNQYTGVLLGPSPHHTILSAETLWFRGAT